MAVSPQAVISASPASGWRIKTNLRLRMLGTLLLLAGVVALLGWCLALLKDPATLPISKIRVQGAFVHLDESMLHRAVVERENQGFFSVNIDAVKQRVEQLPWVEQVSVRRIWPDTLGIEVVEQKALARWASGGLVNDTGRSFNPAADSYPSGLPLFSGPENMLAVMVEQYRRNSVLLVTAGLSITGLAINSRRALTLQLNNGIELVLGRKRTQARLQRFIAVYRKLLATRRDEIVRVDLRYSNGMSVQWKTTAKQNIHQGGE